MFAMGLVTLAIVLCIIGGQALVSSASNRNAYRVVGLEQFGAKDEMYAGLMSLDRRSVGNGAFFFWLAKKRQNSIPEKKRRLVIWLNGGPGCSSMVGMMWENGPFTIHFGENDKKYDLKENPYSWNEVADVLFVEQPIRVGFSPASEGARFVRTEDDVGEDFRSFLVSFLVDFPEYEDAEIFLSGESYAGFYIPWIAEHIVSKQLIRKEDQQTGEVYYERDITVDNINLVGAAIGNGVLDFLFQEPSYAEYAYYHGLIPRAAKEHFEEEWIQCLSSLERENKPLSRKSFNKCDMMAKVLEAAGQPNEYDTSTFLGYDRIIKVGGPFDTFFQDPDIQLALHVRGYNLPGLNFLPENYALVQNRSEALISTLDPMSEQFYYEPPTGWRVCFDDMDNHMKNDHPVSAVPVLQFLVDFETRFDTDVDRLDKKQWKREAKEQAESVLRPQQQPEHRALLTKHRIRGDSKHLRVMLYSGEFDLNCNTLGTLHTLEHNWWRRRPWEEAERGLWKIENNEVGGEYFHFDEVFSFLIVRNSGHLLPMDKPVIALEMLRRFLDNESFLDQPLPKESYYRRPVKPIKASSTNSLFAADSDLSSSVMMVLLVVGWMGFIVSCTTLYNVQKKNANDGYEAIPNAQKHVRRSMLELVSSSTSSSTATGYNRVSKRDFGEEDPWYGSVTNESIVDGNRVAERIHHWEKRTASK